MLYVNLPTREEFLQLSELRSDVCVSIYLKTSPLPQDMQASRIELRNQVKEIISRLEESKFDKRRLEALKDELEDVLEADDFWFFHANSLAVLATPESIRTYRMANEVKSQLEIADRFYLKPLLRSLTFPHTAYILALSENEARVVEFFAEGPPEEVKVENMPKDALSAVGKSSLAASLGGLPHEPGSRGNKMRLAQYARKVDAALRPLLLHSDSPLILISTEPLAPIYRSMSSLSNLVDETIFTNPDRIGISELVALARPVLDNYYARQLDEVRETFELRAGQNRVATDLTDVARAATYGMVSFLLVDFDNTVAGVIDENGKLTLGKEPDEAGAYGVIDEIVKRALACGAKVLAVRKQDMIGNTGVAAILRYTL